MLPSGQRCRRLPRLQEPLYLHHQHPMATQKRPVVLQLLDASIVCLLAPGVRIIRGRPAPGGDRPTKHASGSSSSALYHPSRSHLKLTFPCLCPSCHVISSLPLASSLFRLLLFVSTTQCRISVLLPSHRKGCRSSLILPPQPVGFQTDLPAL